VNVANLGLLHIIDVHVLVLTARLHVKVLVVLPDDFRLQPPAGKVWVVDLNSKLNAGLDKNVDFNWLKGIENFLVVNVEGVLLLLWLHPRHLLDADALVRSHRAVAVRLRVDHRQVQVALLLENVRNRNKVFGGHTVGLLAHTNEPIDVYILQDGVIGHLGLDVLAH